MIHFRKYKDLPLILWQPVDHPLLLLKGKWQNLLKLFLIRYPIGIAEDDHCIPPFYLTAGIPDLF